MYKFKNLGNYETVQIWGPSKYNRFGNFFGSNLHIVYSKFKQKFALESGKYSMQLRILDLTLQESRGPG
jgi:hypothetical protein